MSAELPPAILLMGPTATGKTELAMALSDCFPCEIVSVDSVMVYQSMDIGSAKPDTTTLARYPHQLIDMNDPSQPYSAADFRQDALRVMGEAAMNNKVPLLVGGTMLYFKALLQGIAELPSADPRLRQQIVEDAGVRGWPALHDDLNKLDPVAAARIHPNNRQRIQRALEVCLATGKPFSGFWSQDRDPSASADAAVGTGVFPFRPITIALMPEARDHFNERVSKRFATMLKVGLIDEVRQLYQRPDLNLEFPSLRSVGYRQVWQYLAGQLSKEEMIEKAEAATRQLAKRQMTWLRSWPEMSRLDAGGAQLMNKAQSIIYSQLQSCNSD